MSIARSSRPLFSMTKGIRGMVDIGFEWQMIESRLQLRTAGRLEAGLLGFVFASVGRRLESGRRRPGRTPWPRRRSGSGRGRCPWRFARSAGRCAGQDLVERLAGLEISSAWISMSETWPPTWP